MDAFFQGEIQRLNEEIRQKTAAWKEFKKTVKDEDLQKERFKSDERDHIAEMLGLRENLARNQASLDKLLQQQQPASFDFNTLRDVVSSVFDEKFAQKSLQSNDTSGEYSRTDTQTWAMLKNEKHAIPVEPTSDRVPLPDCWSQFEHIKKELKDQEPKAKTLFDELHDKEAFVQGVTFLSADQLQNWIGKEGRRGDRYCLKKDARHLGNVEAIIEFKAPGKSLKDEDFGQACQEGLYFLQRMPLRSFIHVVLSDFDTFAFIKVERKQEGGFRYHYSSAYPAKIAFGMFHTLLSTPSTKMDCVDLPVLQGMKSHGKWLGTGATSSVFEILMERGPPKAVKVLTSGTNDEEKRILQVLGDEGMGIPVLVEGLTDLENVIVMSPVLSPLTSINWKQIQQLHETLKHIHSRHYVHRDIRVANVMMNTTRAFLVDFGFALPSEEGKTTMVGHSGAVTTASNRILEILVKDDKKKFEYKESDDWASFVKTIYLLNHPDKMKALPKNTEYQNLVNFWKQPPETWHAAFLAKGADDVLQALRTIFPSISR